MATTESDAERGRSQAPARGASASHALPAGREGALNMTLPFESVGTETAQGTCEPRPMDVVTSYLKMLVLVFRYGLYPLGLASFCKNPVVSSWSSL
jgi:hypothetical protein